MSDLWEISDNFLNSVYSAENSDYNMPVGVTEVSQSIFGLHMLIFWICVVIGVIVFSIMFLFLCVILMQGLYMVSADITLPQPRLSFFDFFSLSIRAER